MPALMKNSPVLDTFTADPRQELLREFGGSSLSYSSLQKGVDFFLDQAYGYIAYSLVKIDFERPLCLADPICSDTKREELLKIFMEQHQAPVFIHITKGTAERSKNLGFAINGVGV